MRSIPWKERDIPGRHYVFLIDLPYYIVFFSIRKEHFWKVRTRGSFGSENAILDDSMAASFRADGVTGLDGYNAFSSEFPYSC